MKKLLVFSENNNWQESINLLAAGRSIFNDEYQSYTIIFNPDNEAAENLSVNFDVSIHVIAAIEPYDAANQALVVAVLHREYNFDAVLAASSRFGRAFAPSLAARIKAPLCADVIGITRRSDTVLFIRPTFGARIIAEINCLSSPFMATIMPGIFTNNRINNKHGQIICYYPQNIKESGLKQVAVVKKENTIDITKSEVLISAGSGAKKFLPQLERLANLLGGQLAGSRKLVDSGLIERNRQVGYSGKNVNPRLYMAFGISGSTWHIHGMRKSNYIIAVNTNGNEPICSLADITAEVDAGWFAERLITLIENAVCKTA